MRPSKKNLLILAVVVVVVVALALWAPKANKDSSEANKENNVYSIVYLSTGDAYVGHLRTFPDYQLRDSYVLQVLKDPTDATKNTFQLQPVSEALWAPEVMHINSQNVIFYAPILETSKIGQALIAKEKQK